MISFEYTAVNEAGKKLTGIMNATSSDAVIKKLKSKKLYPLKIKKTAQITSDNSLFNFSFAKKLFSKNIKKSELAEFTRQLGTLIETGVPYHRALEIITPKDPASKMARMLEEIRSKVLEGSSLYKAMSNFSDQFPPNYLSTVRAGEKSGRLGDNLIQQAEFIEAEISLNNKVQSALIYPSIMMLLGIGIVIFMVKYILPKIVPIFSFFDRALPLPTRVMIFLSDFITNYGLISLIVLLAIIVGLNYYFKQPKGRKFFDKLILRLPLFGKMQVELYILRFSLSLGSLLKSGITVKEALTISATASGNSIFQKDINNILELTVTKGYTLSAALKKSNFFDEKYVQLVKVGEESGKLEEMINKLNYNLKLEAESKIQKFVALLEPIIILIMAMMVGAIVLAILLPIFELNLLVQ